ncbi:hypothetical protein, partial [Streptomyces nitrosporeus]|uniref:hypothetical protein n=1 Tax=Streptomyces nitrosporeus TaxID=28894 RepID=UPI0039A2938D
ARVPHPRARPLRLLRADPVSLSIVVRCDVSGPYGTCGRYLPTGAADEAEAYEVARRAGWDAGRGADRCPGHAARRTGRSSGLPCGNNRRAHLGDGDRRAVAEFMTYLQNRKSEEHE